MGSSEDKPVLDYATPRGRAGKRVYLGIASWVFAVLAVLGNIRFGQTSFENYSHLWLYAKQMGHSIPAAHEVWGWRIPFGAMSYCMAMIDVVVHVALAGVLAVAGFMAMGTSPHAEAVYRLYIRWKIVFACVGLYVDTQLMGTVGTFTRHKSLGSDEIVLVTFLCAIVVPLVLLWDLRRVRA
ncbi:MAG: hypothetical protein ACM359_03485 [Bacillota bacterium]